MIGYISHPTAFKVGKEFVVGHTCVIALNFVLFKTQWISRKRNCILTASSFWVFSYITLFFWSPDYKKVSLTLFGAAHCLWYLWDFYSSLEWAQRFRLHLRKIFNQKVLHRICFFLCILHFARLHDYAIRRYTLYVQQN